MSVILLQHTYAYLSILEERSELEDVLEEWDGESADSNNDDESKQGATKQIKRTRNLINEKEADNKGNDGGVGVQLAPREAGKVSNNREGDH